MEILIFRTTKTSDQLKESLVRRWLNSSLTMADFAQGMQISPEVFARWAAKYRKTASATTGSSKRRRENRLVLVKLDRKSLYSSEENSHEEKI